MEHLHLPIRSVSKLATLRRAAYGLFLAAAVGAPIVGVARAQDPFVEIDAEPQYYEAHPHTTYNGETVYYVGGRWYAHHGRRWAYYREEPGELVQYRRDYHEPREHHHHEHLVEVRRR